MVNISTMPAENTFKKHAELVCDKNFLTVHSLNAPGLINTAITDLINATLVDMVEKYICKYINFHQILILKLNY